MPLRLKTLLLIWDSWPFLFLAFRRHFPFRCPIDHYSKLASAASVIWFVICHFNNTARPRFWRSSSHQNQNCFQFRGSGFSLMSLILMMWCDVIRQEIVFCFTMIDLILDMSHELRFGFLSVSVSLAVFSVLEFQHLIRSWSLQSFG